MNWRHFEARKTGTVQIITREGGNDCRFEIGAISTGKQRVFHSHYVRIILPDGTEMIGEDQHNLHSALVELDHKLRAEGFELPVAGMDPRFYETGLSHNSGWGYNDAIGRVHMMDPIAELDASDDLDAVIREAVAGIGSWTITENRTKM